MSVGVVCLFEDWLMTVAAFVLGYTGLRRTNVQSTQDGPVGVQPVLQVTAGGEFWVDFFFNLVSVRSATSTKSGDVYMKAQQGIPWQ